MRQLPLSTFAFVCIVACGGGDGMQPDAPGAVDVGFNKPKMSLQANMEGSNPQTWIPVGPADLSCLGSANADVPTTFEVTLDTTVRDFEKGFAVGSAAVVAFPGIQTDQAFFTGSSDGSSGIVGITVPVGTTRFGIEMSRGDSMDTFLLNQKVDAAGSAVQTTPDKIQIVSKGTAQTLPAIIGIQRTPGTGVVAGAVRDCQAHEMSNFIVTLSSTSGSATPIDGAPAFYFAASVGLPVHHDQADASSADGLFMVIQAPVTATAYVQAWGYVTDADVTSDHLSLISELAVPVLADTVVTGSFEPLRAP